MKITLLIFIISVLIINFSFAQNVNHAEMDDQENCQKCHYCNQPTKKDPCLRSCPRTKVVTSQQMKEETPHVLVLDLLSDMYVPVVFSHKLHAEMADMAGGCGLCHHYNPEGAILSCQQCHSNSPKRTNLSQPSLKGAYHRQCLGCHREWSHTTKCAVCHALKSSSVRDVTHVDTTDIVGRSHPPIPEPEKVLYETNSDQGTFVTFYHDEHINRFGFLCVDCHQKEGCGKCHDLTKPTLAEQMIPGKALKVEKSESEHHKLCEDCHSGDKCNHCHATNAKARFDHQLRSGWKLNKYHISISCRECHQNTKSIGKVSRQCNLCHKNWNNENFNHRITGVVLDENHLDNDCSDCHLQNNYATSPSCADCHEEDISYPEKLPGKRIY